jgi:hypothetical protein
MRSHLTPVKAIRAKCLDCCCGEHRRVRECLVRVCALWPYRMGTRPRREQEKSQLFAETNATPTSLLSGPHGGQDPAP